MLLKDSVFVLCINDFRCSLKTGVSLVLATEHLKLSCPEVGVRIREVRLYSPKPCSDRAFSNFLRKGTVLQTAKWQT